MSDGDRAWESVLAHVEGLLLTGALSPGDRLPGERVLALELGVGRSSVREAVRVLEVMGLIRTRTGSGPTSGAVIVARPTGGMSALLRLQVAASGFAVEDVVRTRLVLETAVVDDLARTTPVALDDSRELLDAMDAETLEHDAFLALDQQFHLSLAEASGNAVIAAMTAGLRDAVEGYVLAAARSLPDWPSTRDRLRREHRALVAAVDAADPELARHLVQTHISGYYAETHLTAKKD
ncbi:MULTISPECIES: FadR/GntR family transcriptional regulator [unclassified Rathayibacter]|uniref:FadR/GntR family transcriptional regulator n=1 Tax=unclassified Rathayibacter TaxID=2609250 RepID=UPI0006F84F12|nr:MULTISPECIES: FCD domain-containing protein [unclassified Rathayibacter]KQQ01442.1 GntR family transcriptional regulator [Rathayibacter sp. Leaf294]KQS11474.1 GntR family transcriptional regulator [Rathayibacter sp. Leaf185]